MGCEHPDWLPAGWKVRVKIRSSGKKDKYYINPVDGLKFSSKPEVLRYLESSTKDDNPNVPNKSCVEGEGQMSISDNVDESLSGDEMGKSGLKLATDVKYNATNVAKGQTSLSQKADESFLCVNSGESGSKATFVKTGERRRSLRLVANKLKDRGMEDSSLSQTGGNAQNTVTTTTTVPNTSKRKSEIELPRRTSKRLAGVKVEIEAHPLNRKPAKATHKAAASNEGKSDAERNNNNDDGPKRPLIFP
ncbi:uncharacterized protein LOC127256278 [Andrographis paniculata]|uniref:uncharacterized protein LOC127256278 n=1 Tax=Andrographis paniculata TaxID=175694 RepID=UPI0021E8428E|nr:uncharacterized protein LOC127256278 [Andrographis paniculata]